MPMPLRSRQGRVHWPRDPVHHPWHGNVHDKVAGNWGGVEALDGLTLSGDLVAALERRGSGLSSLQAGIRFYTPTFKSYQTSEIRGCGHNAWPAVSITGSDCKLQCDHCKAKILAPMIPARTPEELWRVVSGPGGGWRTGHAAHGRVQPPQ